MEAKAYLDNDRIEVFFSGGEESVREAARSVSGGRKMPGKMAWHYPLSVDVCREMRTRWGNRMKVHKDLSSWYREAAMDREDQTVRSNATVSNLQVLPVKYPELHAWLKEDQRVGAEWIANGYRNGGLLADEGGVGKTATIIAGLLERETQGNILVICPKVSVRSVWGRHFEKHSDIPCYVARGTRAKREATIAAFMADTSPRRALVIVAEMLRVRGTREKGRLTVTGAEYPQILALHWSAIILDEGHKLLGSLDVKNGNLAGEGLCRLIYDDQTFRLCATATPWGKGGRVESLFGTLHWLWPDEYPSKWRWINKFFEVTKNEVFIKGGGGRTKEVTRVGGLLPGSSEQELYGSLGPRVLRRTMAEVSPAHAGLKNWVEMSCGLEGAQEKQYATFAENAEVPVTGGIVSTTGTLDYFTRCRQIANGVIYKGSDDKVKYTGESSKIDALFEYMEQTGMMDGTSDKKIVIASQFNEFLDVVGERLAKAGIAYHLLTGSTTEAHRERMMDEFQGEKENTRVPFTGRVNGQTSPGSIRRCPGCGVSRNMYHEKQCSEVSTAGPRVFMLNSKAGGVSITLDAADEMHQLDEMYPPEANEQLYWRIFRRGRVHQVFYFIYRGEGTVDEKIGFNIAEGTASQLAVLDGRRGLDYARTLGRYEKPGSK